MITATGRALAKRRGRIGWTSCGRRAFLHAASSCLALRKRVRNSCPQIGNPEQAKGKSGPGRILPVRAVEKKLLESTGLRRQ